MEREPKCLESSEQFENKVLGYVDHMRQNYMGFLSLGQRDVSELANMVLFKHEIFDYFAEESAGKKYPYLVRPVSVIVSKSWREMVNPTKSDLTRNNK